MEVNGNQLIEYLPTFMQNYQEIILIMKADQQFIDSLKENVNQIQEDQYISFASENGVARWEQMLSITPSSTDDLDTRKSRIISKLQFNPPYTSLKIKETLIALCGKRNVELSITPKNYYVEVKVRPITGNKAADVQELIKNILPANMTYKVTELFNRNDELAALNHLQLSSYTHSIIKIEVIT